MENKPDIAAMLNTTEAATFLGVTKHALAWYRQRKEGPIYYRHIQAIYYKPEDLEEWQVRKGQEKIEVIYPKSHPLYVEEAK